MWFFCLRPEMQLLCKSGPKIRNCLFKVKFSTLSNFNNIEFNGLVGFFHIWPKKFSFGKLIRICRTEFNGDDHFFRFSLEIPFFSNFGPKTQNCQFKLKFRTLAYFEYVKVDCDVYFSCFRPFFQVLSKQSVCYFWCYLINLPAVYSRDLASIVSI